MVLQQLRDHLPLELLAHYGAQLPMIVRGAFYDRFDPTGLPKSAHGSDEFVKAVYEGLQASRGRSARCNPVRLRGSGSPSSGRSDRLGSLGPAQEYPRILAGQRNSLRGC